MGKNNGERRAIARSHANIAVAKYWGKRDPGLNLPLFDSVSLNLDGLYTETTAAWNDEDARDALSINGWDVPVQNLGRMQTMLDEIRRTADLEGLRCVLTSTSNFPHSAGLASSASGCAAAAAAAAAAAGLQLSEAELSGLARLGSGSAARSIPDGWVHAFAGSASDGTDFLARSIAPASHWNLHVFVVMIDAGRKPVPSSEAMLRCTTSPFWNTYVDEAKTHAAAAQDAIVHKDFSALARVVHDSTSLLHALCATAREPIYYITPKTLEFIRHFQRQARSIPVCITLDAGPNVVLLCEDVVYPFVKNDIIELGLPYIQTHVGNGTSILA